MRLTDFRPFLKLAAAVVLALACTAVASAQQHVELLPAAAGDLVATELVAPVTSKAMRDVPRERVAVSRALDSELALDSESVPFVARSREYRVDVTADELGRGVALYTESANALVRLNPAPVTPGTGRESLEKAAIDPLRLVLVDPAGNSWVEGSGMEQLVQADQLARTDLPFAAGTSAFRLRSDLGAGAFELRAEGLRGERRYVMHVMDAESDVELTLRTGSSDYLHGQTLEVEASLVRGDRRFHLKEVDGYVTSPAGRAWPVQFERVGPGIYRATLELDALEAPTPGLWEVHAAAHSRVAGQPVLRNARTAFACAVPAAGFHGTAEIVRGDAWGVGLGVDVAAAGRYDVRGVLYGTAPDGTLRPAGIAQTATWLEAGRDVLELEFSRQVLEANGLGAPFEVRDLRLSDQGRMGVLHRQSRGLRLE